MNPQQMYVACTDALGAFVRGAGFTDVVIGLSGGMDSTLVAVMAADVWCASWRFRTPTAGSC